MSVEQTEDLKAFERRLTEVISGLKPAAARWRAVLVLSSICVFLGAIYWLGDPATAEVPFLVSLHNHPYFSLSCFVLFLFFLAGIHRRVVAPSIIVSRTREVLFDFSMDCDDTGKLILKPRITS